MAGPANTPHTPITIEWTDKRGLRQRRQFTDPVAARRFYCAKNKAGCGPAITHERQTLSENWDTR